MTDKEYFTITEKMAELKTPEDFKRFEKEVLSKINPNEPLLQSLMNVYGMIRGIRQENS